MKSALSSQIPKLQHTIYRIRPCHGEDEAVINELCASIGFQTPGSCSENVHKCYPKGTRI